VAKFTVLKYIVLNLDIGILNSAYAFALRPQDADRSTETFKVKLRNI
jgi:hypothetical protein